MQKVTSVNKEDINKFMFRIKKLFTESQITED